MKKTNIQFSLLLAMLLVSVYILFQIENGNPTYFQGKGGGISIQMYSIIIYSTILYSYSDINPIILRPIVGFLYALISCISVYFIHPEPFPFQLLNILVVTLPIFFLKFLKPKRS